MFLASILLIEKLPDVHRLLRIFEHAFSLTAPGEHGIKIKLCGKTNTKKELTMKKLIITTVAASITLSGVAFAAAPTGASLMDSRCTVCHNTDRIKTAKKSFAQWEATVVKMTTKGAKLTADEKKMLIEYLAKTFK